MIITKKNHEVINKNDKTVKKSQKYDVNLQTSSTLYFQVGLIVVLLVVYGLFEMKFETTILPPPIAMSNPVDDVFFDVIEVKEKKPEAKHIEVKKEKRKIPDEFKEVPDDLPFEELKNNVLQPVSKVNNSFSPDDLILEESPEESNFFIDFVEQVPIYPGCEKAKDNTERRACMSDKINKLIQKKFNGNIASEYGLTGLQRINVGFKIDKTGHVTDIKTRATHPKLKEEAERVIKEIPVMLPGKQQNNPVDVIYSLPIIFKVQN